MRTAQDEQDRDDFEAAYEKEYGFPPSDTLIETRIHYAGWKMRAKWEREQQQAATKPIAELTQIKPPQMIDRSGKANSKENV